MEQLLPTLILISLVILVIWLFTTGRFRKSIGNSLTKTIEVQANNMVRNAEMSAIASEVETINEFLDQGMTEASIYESGQMFDRLIARKPKPTATSANNS